ncbi:hypothetical protein BAE46_03105 [Glaciecola punicea]|uniref:CatB-related O-acetyltransferase n=1 Tax=Glaciecola punicea TaxID=56804 RepID=UPI00087303CB|nr:CatB-related O-acetyltransferase [Glaciecola punicea]OFA32758.1 hypothetical protein BAE46_03105 [Glaciecola punicea]
MYALLKRVVKYIYLSIKHRGELKLSFSVNILLGSTFEGMNQIYSQSNFSGELGFGSYIGENSRINACIGRYTSIGSEVKVIQGTHPYTYPFVSTSPVFYSLKKQNGYTFTDKQRFNEILVVDNQSRYGCKIGNDCWIGDRATIIGTVVIGDGSIVLAGAVVTKDVPAYAIVAGVPAKVIKYRYNEDTIAFLLNFKWWGKDPEWLKNNVDLMNDLKRLECEHGLQ